MNNNNPGSKPGFNLSDWLRPTRSAESSVASNRVRPATSSQATQRKASHEDSNDEDDHHPALDDTTLHSALAALKAGNEAAAPRKSGGGRIASMMGSPSTSRDTSRPSTSPSTSAKRTPLLLLHQLPGRSQAQGRPRGILPLPHRRSSSKHIRFAFLPHTQIQQMSAETSQAPSTPEDGGHPL